MSAIPSAVMEGTDRLGPARGLFDQLFVLTSSDLRARYGRGRWQLVKWLIDPFALVGVYLLMITFIFHRRGHAVGLSLACSVIPFQLIAMTVQGSLRSIPQRQTIIANTRFRRILLPISTALTEASGLAASSVLLVVMMAVYGVGLSSSIIWLAPTLVLVVLLGIAVAYPMTLVGIWAPDLAPLMMSAARSAYYLAPGLVTLAAMHGRTSAWVRANPLTGLFEALRHSVLYRSAPPAWELLFPLLAAVAILAVSVPIYLREQDHFAKVVE